MKLVIKCRKASTFFSKRLTETREKARLSKNQLSERSGLSQSYLVRLEQGERNPTLETLVRLSHGLEIPLVELVAGIDEVTS
ncbi:MAG: transcriptional regulator with XRE-family HTH domain [Akkermansiaceae bacterium]|jgi:transcriptional regulator with XRE-family HTH domain